MGKRKTVGTELAPASSTTAGPQILTTKKRPPGARKCAPKAPSSAELELETARVRAFLETLEPRVSQLRETVAMGRKRPELAARAIGEAAGLLSDIAAAAPRDAGALGPAGAKLAELRALVERATMGRL